MGALLLVATACGTSPTEVDSGPVDGSFPDAAVGDRDGDGVPAATDCDDGDPSVGASATRTCMSACASGTESCVDGVWGVCSASADCACDTPEATRIATCGACGSQSQRCTAALTWEPTGPCLGEGECVAATTEFEALGFCGERARLCDAECVWGAWEETMAPAGECESGDTRSNSSGCAPGSVRNEVCSATCAWEPTTGECESGCSGTARTSPAWAEEICIPAGPFIRGHVGERGAEPVAEVMLSAYWIDRFPVTNDRYRACVDAGVCAVPRTMFGVNSLADATRGQFPLQDVSWEQAGAFCEWDDRRLPTEAEFEKAARGPAPRDQPYLWDGSDYRCDLFFASPCGYEIPRELALQGWLPDEVDSLPGTSSFYGVEMLHGSGRHWVHDYWGLDYYSDPSSLVDPQGPTSGTRRQLRGSRRTGCPESRYLVGQRQSCGAAEVFRCVRSAS